MIDNTMKIYDISMEINSDMPVYNGKESLKPIIKVDRDFTMGPAYESRLEMNMHTGTHLDRGLHMIPDGSTIDTLSLDQVVTKCKVFDLSNADDRISKNDLEKRNIEENDFILLKTKNSFLEILETDYIFVDQSGADYLVEKKIKGVGIDSLGIERSQPNHETHIHLLEAGIVILEGLRLKDIEEGDYFLFAAPIKVYGVEAASVRAVLLK